MGCFFYLSKNTSTTVNDRLTIINTSVPYPYLTIGANGLQEQRGWKYRPAIRMQFSPAIEFSNSTEIPSVIESNGQVKSGGPWVFPSSIKIMKKADYDDDIFSQNVEFKYFQKKLNQYEWTDKTDQTTINSVFYGEQCESNDPRKNNLMRGIAFHQYVAYQQLNFIFQYTKELNSITQNIYVYNTNRTAVLYQGRRVVTSNYLENPFQWQDDEDYVKINLYYVHPSNSIYSNSIYATLYIKKSFYTTNGRIYSGLTNDFDSSSSNNSQQSYINDLQEITFVGNAMQFRIQVRFNNFISNVGDDFSNVEITNLSYLNGVYSQNGTIKNSNFIYYNTQNGNYYIYKIKDITNNFYWVISDIILDDTINTTIEQNDHVLFYSTSLITTQEEKWRYPVDSIYGYFDVINQQTDVPIVSRVIDTNANALQINYSNEDINGCINLIGEDSKNNIRYCSELPDRYRWIYKHDVSKKQIWEQAVFTRTYQTDLTDNNIHSDYQYSQNDRKRFYVDSNNGGQYKYTIYFDYLKQNDNGYLIPEIANYFNQQIVVFVQFGVWGETGTSSQIKRWHDVSTHYKYAFGFVDDYYKTSQRSLYLLHQEQPIDFLLNGKQNTVIDEQNYLDGSGFPRYINYNDKYYANIKELDDYNLDDLSSNVSSSNPSYNESTNCFRRIIKYRYSQTQFDQNEGDYFVKWNQISQYTRISQFNEVVSIQNPNAYIQFARNQQNTKQVFLQVADNEFNVSHVVKGNLTVYSKSPTSTFIKITGTNGGTNYTGVCIDDSNQEFIVDNKILVQFSAYSDIDLYYKITGSVYKQYLQKDENGEFVLKSFDQYRPFDATNNILTLQLISQSEYTTKVLNTNSGSALKQIDKDGNFDKSKIQTYQPQGVLNANQKRFITVTFRDQAGNVASVTGSIVFNTVLFETQNRNLKQATSTYDLQLYKTSNNVNTLIARTDTKKSSTKRNWRDIFYPTTHGYPTLANGDINITQTLKITQATDSFDPVVRNNGQIVYDEQGRTTTVWSNRKKYPTMVSSYGDISNEYSGFVYWIIDNTGYGDITLQFQHFYLDSVAYGPPYNQNLGQRPDSLVVYDASQQGCVMQSVNSVGQVTYKLKDTQKLKQLQVYTGSGSNVMSLLTGTVNASAQGQFTTQAFATQRICLIFYSDYRNSTDSAASPIGSGFKLKAAKEIVQYWHNFDVDSTNGLIWTHVSSDNQQDVPAGLSVEEIKMTYDYYNTKLTIDYDQGSVIFDELPKDKNGNPSDVFATYTYYSYDQKDRQPCRTFLLDSDDLVDYADVNLYYLPKGTTPIKTDKTAPIYKDIDGDGIGQYSTYKAGKLNNYFFIDKDRGVIQFNNGISLSGDENGLVPRGRIFADYRYHTYDRLGNDGYSDFQFNDSVLIAGITTQYPDYTWGDIKIVNEGDAQLRDGRIIFLARGQVENNVITSVLDYDRPWDVQQGTAQETYDRVAVVIRKNYAWNSYTCTRDQAKNLYKTSGVNIFPDVIKPKEVFYGRVVYCLGGSNDSYPTTTAGRKTFSSEISGRFIQVD